MIIYDCRWIAAVVAGGFFFSCVGLYWPVRFIGCSGRVDRAEVELCRALIIRVVGQEGPGCAMEVRDTFASRFGLRGPVVLRLCRAAPNSFLVFSPSEDLSDRVFNGGQPLHVPHLRMHVKWGSHQAFASGSGVLPLLLDVELWGVHAHVWGIETTEGGFAWCALSGSRSATRFCQWR